MLQKLFFISVIIFLFTVYFHNIIEFDQDLGRHLLLGKIISETKQIPNTNLFSYTYTNFPFINTHWLAEVIFYQIKSLTALLFFKVAILVSAMTLTVFTAYHYSKNLLATALAFAIFSPVLLERTEIRPEIFTYLFTAIFVYLIIDNKPKKHLYFLLPVLEIIWVNSHIYFIVGPILLFIASLKNRDWLSIFLITSLVTVINPNGLIGGIYPFTVFNNYGYTIVENQNIFFLKDVISNPNINYFIFALILFSASFFLNKKNYTNIFNLMISSLVILPIMVIRSFPLLFLVELPILAFNLSKLSFKKYLVVGIIALTFFRSFRLATNDYYQSINSPKRFGIELNESGSALDFVIDNNLSGPIFNNFDIGSYLDYRLFPKELVFVDGRPEAYPTKFFQNLYIPMQTSVENFNLVDDKFKFNLIIFTHTDATPWGQTFLKDIIKNEKFQMVYFDYYAVVFVRKEKYPQFTKTEIHDTGNFLALAQAFKIFGDNNNSQKYFIKAILQNPNISQKSSLILF